jgi:hypothetical protein
LLNAYEIHDTRDLASFLLDEDNDAEARAEVADLFDQLGIDADQPDEYDVTVIPDGMFKEYAMQLADDLGFDTAGLAWPACCIDWDEAADMLIQDYTSAEVNGISYWFRA